MSWEDVWNSAQTKLSSIRTGINSFTHPNSRIIRVGQLDSELLDQELVNLLQDPLRKSLSLVNASLQRRFEPELNLLIHLVLYKLSVWDLGASYGAKLQGLRYVVPTSRGQPLASSGLPRRILLLHGTLTILIPYIHTRLRVHGLSRAWPDAPSSDRRRKAWDLLVSLESTYTAIGLVGFVAFLWNGRYRTIADRIFGMRLVPTRRLVQRDVSYEFMNRQMVWHAFTEFLLFLLPLINRRRIQRRARTFTSIMSSFLRPSTTTVSANKIRGKYWSLSEDECAICAENASYSLNIANANNAFTSIVSAQTHSAENLDSVPSYPIHTPYITSCGHTYCYHCLAERMLRHADEDGEQGWECLRCAQAVQSASRHIDEGAVDTESELSGSEYDFSTFSSDMDSDNTGL